MFNSNDEVAAKYLLEESRFPPPLPPQNIFMVHENLIPEAGRGQYLRELTSLLYV